jgi:hypothetical protein
MACFTSPLLSSGSTRAYSSCDTNILSLPASLENFKISGVIFIGFKGTTTASARSIP